VARKWIPCPDEGIVIVNGQLALLTLEGQGKLGVDFYPQWHRGKVLAYMPIPTFIDDPAGWKSEFRGDDPPKRSGWYVVTVEQKTAGKYTLEKSYYDSKKGRWCGAGGEVLAYMELPKPYKRVACRECGLIYALFEEVGSRC
jgi:hypothetical protein